MTRGPVAGHPPGPLLPAGIGGVCGGSITAATFTAGLRAPI